MDLSGLTRMHWALIGLLIAPLISALRPNLPTQRPRLLQQRQFEQMVAEIPGQLQGVTLHSDGRITGMLRTSDSAQTPLIVQMANPFVPQGPLQAPTSKPTPREYLDWLMTQNIGFRYRN